jgi:hypothetical protein
MESMTQADYARHRKCSRAMVTKLIGSGRIPAASFVEQGGGRRLIDPVAADFAPGEARQRVLVGEAEETRGRRDSAA